ncbi:MAG: hypothetical protein K9L30_16045 [Desulfobacterales bacterium]|nr:hypothetical protein [Desulfobacterales bacterium]
MKTYSLPWEYKIIIMPVILIGAILASLPPYEKLFQLIMPVIAFWLWYKFLTTPYRVDLTENKTILLSGFFMKSEINVHDIKSIEQNIITSKISHVHAVRYIPNSLKGFSGFINEIKTLNPEIKITLREHTDLFRGFFR